MLNDITVLIDQVIHSLQVNSILLARIIAVGFAVTLVNMLLGWRLNFFGIRPRNIFGLVGIFIAPFLHDGFKHLIMNAIMFFIMANLLLLNGFAVFVDITILLIIASGLLTWLLGRSGVHVGASSVIMGYWSYLIVDGYHNPGLITIATGFICFYYFAGLTGNLFPSLDDKHVAWEGHLFGFASGIGINYLYPYIVSIMPILFN